MGRYAIGLVAVLLAGETALRAAMVVERWGVAGRLQHPNTLRYEARSDGTTLMGFDLTALPEKARVYRARLFFRRPERYGRAFDIVPLWGRGARRGEARLAAAGPPLRLRPPRYRLFDATEAVRHWVGRGVRQGWLWIRKAPGFPREAAWLEIAYEGRLERPPRQAGGVEAFHRSGQVFIRFKEIEDFAGGKAEITWGELARKRFGAITYEGPVPRDDDGEIRYRIYMHARPLTAETVGEAQLLADVVPGSGYNTRLVPMGDFVRRRPRAVARRLAVEPGRPLPPGFGLYVHTVREAGRRYYAVVTSLDGRENTVAFSRANVAGPVEQEPGAPEPVLQREALTPLRPSGTYHEQWYAYWGVPPQAPRPLRYDFAIGFCPESLLRPAPLTVPRGHTWQPKPEMPRPAARPGIVMSMGTDPPNGFWTGVNDARDTLRGIEEGRWRPFTHNRQEVLIRWVARRWPIDEGRVVAAIGAWGLWELRRGDLYAYIHGWGMPEVTKGFQCWNWARGAWGPPSAYAGKPEDENPYFLQDYARYVLEDPGRELPYFWIHTGWGAHFREMGWPPFPRFVRALIETKRAFNMHSRAFERAVREGALVIRRDRSLPAFGNCSLDDNLGDGDPLCGTPFGQVNGYLLWDAETIIDEPARWAMTIWLDASAPLDACTVDLTPRRCRAFRAEPGRPFRWTNAFEAPRGPLPGPASKVRDLAIGRGRAIQSGDAEADAAGLVTIKALVVTKAKHRVTIAVPSKTR